MLKLAIQTSRNRLTNRITVKPAGIGRPRVWPTRTYTYQEGGAPESGHLRAMRRWADEFTPHIGPVVDTAWTDSGYVYTFGRIE